MRQTDVMFSLSVPDLKTTARKTVLLDQKKRGGKGLLVLCPLAGALGQSQQTLRPTQGQWLVAHLCPWPQRKP